MVFFIIIEIYLNRIILFLIINFIFIIIGFYTITNQLFLFKKKTKKIFTKEIKKE